MRATSTCSNIGRHSNTHTHTHVTIYGICREGRLRHHLGVRYDSRKGVFDWDYNMRLLELVSGY